MALNRLTQPLDPSTLLLISTGGEGRERPEFKDGARTGAPVMRNGAAVRRVSGIAVSLAGQGLDGIAVDTSTPLDAIPAGTVLRAEGEAELSIRADAKPGFNGGAPRGELQVSLFVERLAPVPTAEIGAVLARAQGKAEEVKK